MARAKQASKRKRSRQALPVWGAAGMSLAMAGGASAAVVNGEKASPQRTLPVITLGEEELSDVVLSKFFVYDREATASSRLGEQYAQRCGGGCRGCGGAGRCGGGGCARPDAAEPDDAAEDALWADAGRQDAPWSPMRRRAVVSLRRGDVPAAAAAAACRGALANSASPRARSIRGRPRWRPCLVPAVRRNCCYAHPMNPTTTTSSSRWRSRSRPKHRRNRASYYDKGGNVTSKASTDSQGTTTFYDASGKVTGRTSTGSGGTIDDL